MPCVDTRHNIFSLCSKLVGHLSMGGRLCVATAFIKQRAFEVTTIWDNKVDDAPLIPMIEEVLT